MEDTPPHSADTDNAAKGSDRKRLLRAFNVSLAFVFLLVVVFTAQSSFDVRIFSVRPWHIEGLLGVLTAPLLHGSIEHLAANAVALLILGTLTGTIYPHAALRALPLLWIGSGLGAWLLGDRSSYHLGASGLTHGLMFLIFVLGLLRRDRASIAAGMIAFLFYGGMLLTVLPFEPGVSWQSHMGGAMAGILSAFLFRRADPLPPPPRYSWEDEEDDLQRDDDQELELPRPENVPTLRQWPERSSPDVVVPFPERRTSSSSPEPPSS
ncbi:MAG: rhomboid family intramembrane serine protease [Xanthomonadaceae bacterium]|jgi:membrane associated rhomboid family serine protease|nr:rhomboid family intramembrane serine protease [Xanthomonadaceae bacterium]